MRERLLLGKYQPLLDQAISEAAAGSFVRRILKKDATLWKEGADHIKIIENALGWLFVARDMRQNIPEICSFTEKAKQMGFSSACLLGMGGSSLCPEVCALTFGSKAGYLQLHVLDTTNPAHITRVESSLDLSRTLFIVASKSGGTIESASLHRYFHDKLRKSMGASAGEHFVAITDPGTPMAKLAQDQGFMKIFLNPKDIGGRYSALSYFGLVPMALIGIDIEAILDRAIAMSDRCAEDANAWDNPGILVGAALGALAKAGLDKVTFSLAPEIRSFGYWVEQLIAESTGKEGMGILPIEGENIEAPTQYQQDRVFVHLGMAGKTDAAAEARLRALSNAGHPVLQWDIEDTLDLGGEFFLWEFATAVAGAVMRINPFDQPNVQESKNNTQQFIQAYLSTGRLEEGSPVLSEGGLSLYCEPSIAKVLARKDPEAGQSRIEQLVHAFLQLAQPTEYLAILAYLDRSASCETALHALRAALFQNLKRATTVGFGPRFLHSTGQLHKGGANNGIFLQITARDTQDIEIPGVGYSFGTLKKAQALGDLQSLVMHGRRAMRLHIEDDVVKGLESIIRLASNPGY